MMYMSTRTRAIEITVDPQTGAQEYHAEGFVGPACLEPAVWGTVFAAPALSTVRGAYDDGGMQPLIGTQQGGAPWQRAGARNARAPPASTARMTPHTGSNGFSRMWPSSAAPIRSGRTSMT